MKRESGITLVTLVITVIIMGILATLLVKASVDGNLFKKTNNIEENFYDMVDDVEKKTENIEQQWDGIV